MKNFTSEAATLAERLTKNPPCEDTQKDRQQVHTMQKYMYDAPTKGTALKAAEEIMDFLEECCRRQPWNIAKGTSSFPRMETLAR